MHCTGQNNIGIVTLNDVAKSSGRNSKVCDQLEKKEDMIRNRFFTFFGVFSSNRHNLHGNDGYALCETKAEIMLICKDVSIEHCTSLNVSRQWGHYSAKDTQITSSTRKKEYVESRLIYFS